MIYLYAVVDGLEDATGIRGVADEPLHIAQAHGLSLACGEMQDVPTVSRDTLAAQDRTVRTLHARAAALLPMRFGVGYATPDDIATALQVHADQLGNRLALVRDREQMTLRISGVPHAITAPTSGTDYLRARATPPEIASLMNSVAPLVHATIVQRAHGQAGVVSIYHLVDRGSSDGYRERMETAARHEPALRVHISGPGPCYAFT